MYASVPSSNAVEAWLVHSRGFLSLNSSATIPELTTPCSLILRTMRTNASLDHGGVPVRAAINWPCSSLRTPAAGYIISWLPATSIVLYSHPIACYFLFLVLPVLLTIFNCASRVIFSVTTFAASQWAEWCLRCSWVSVVGKLDEVPVILLDSVPLSPCWGVCAAMICCCGSEEMMITKWKGMSWGRRQRNEVGRPEEYIVSFKSKWHA